MRTLKQIFCKHRWEFISKNSIVNEVLEQCEKCKLYNVWHRGINTEYKTKYFPTNKGWEPMNKRKVNLLEIQLVRITYKFKLKEIERT